MKKYLGIISLILTIVILVPATLVLAAYDYYIPITISNNYTEDRGNLPILVTINNTQFADMGYINSTALDTDVQEGASSREFMVGDSRLGIFLLSILSYQSRTYLYRLGDSPGQTTFPVMVGVGGNITVSDDSSLELGNNFTIEMSGWINTDSGADKNLVIKENAIEIFISPTVSEDITAAIYGDAISDNISVAASTDDAYRCLGNTPSFSLVADDVSAGAGGPNFHKQGSGMRFLNIGLYQGATITSAYITFTSMHNTADDTVKTYISAWDVDDASTFDSQANFDAAFAAHTTARIDWTFTTDWTTDNTFDSISIVTVIQEILNRPGWEFNNSIVLFWEDFDDRSTGDNVMRYAYSFDNAPAKAPLLHIETSDGGTIDVTATGVSSGEHTIATSANITHLVIIVDEGEASEVLDIVALSGASVPDNDNDWTLVENNVMPYMDKLEVSVNSTQKLWIEPNTMVIPANLPDRSGNGNIGTISWGSNPTGIEITIGGLNPAEAYVPEVAGVDEVKDFLPDAPAIEYIPPSLADDSPELQAMPQYDAVYRWAQAAEMSTEVAYVILIWITAMVMGVGGFVAVGSGWGFIGGAGFVGALGMGTPVWPLFLPLIGGIVLVLGVYVWRTH